MPVRPVITGQHPLTGAPLYSYQSVSGPGVAGTIASAIGPQLLLTPAMIGLQNLLNRVRYPKLKPGDILKAAVAIKEVAARGGTPRAATDPQTGNLVIFEASQNPALLLAEREFRQQAGSGPEFSEELYRLRQAFIEQKRRTTANSPEATSRRMAIVGASAVGATRRLAGPGRVTKDFTMPRLSGPCAGVVSGIQKLRCNRGSFA